MLRKSMFAILGCLAMTPFGISLAAEAVEPGETAEAASPESAIDTDNVQSETVGSTDSGVEAASSADTDNVQSGSQSEG